MAGQQSSFTHDVFLCFSGSDTGHGFTDNLLKALRERGFRTFIEDEDLPRGDEVIPALVKAIKQSRIVIIVISRNYAASSLVYIRDHLQQGNHQFIFPVFYDVDPVDVKQQRGIYGEALARLEDKLKDNKEKEKVQKWRNAPSHVANLSGWHFKHGDGYDEFQFFARIVEEASNRAPLPVADEFKFIERIVEEVSNRAPLPVADSPGRVRYDEFEFNGRIVEEVSNRPPLPVADPPVRAVNDEFQFNGRIEKEVSRKFNAAPLPITDYLIGMESPLEEVCALLELGSDGVLMAGMWGMGGIGKTTLAAAVYNRIADQFDGSCFVANVRENSNKHGLVPLQNMLLSEIVGEKDIQLGDVSKGISIIRSRLRQKKILLILDDVDKLQQLEALVGEPDWFGSGSRVIITTRDRHLLAFKGIDRQYEVQALNHRDALQLLSNKALKQGNVDPSYTEILNQTVTYASGHPLALEVIGSYLFGKSVDEWRSALDRFQRIPYEDIQNILKVSFDGLEKDGRSVFLDIACCFNGYDLAKVQDILCAHYGYNVEYHIKVLIDKSLIRISSDGKVKLHPLVEGMGKEIVRRESPMRTGERSRLWFPRDILYVLKENMGTNKIEIIHLDSTLMEGEIEIGWDERVFMKMENLRTLIIRKCHFSKALKHLPRRLRVLELQTYPSQELPSNFDPKQLYICKLPGMDFISPKLVELRKISPNVPKVSQTSQIVLEVSQTSQSIPEVLQTSTRVARVMLQISKRDFQAETVWRLVGLMSSVVGLLCYALSPSFNRLIGRWNSFKFFLYGVLSLIICTTILFAKQSSLSTQHVQLKTYTSFAVLMIISVYSFLYDKAVSGKPEILSLVSNAAFAVVSLSMSKLIKFGFEMGIFSYFLGCLAVQLWTINWKLILVAIIFGCPLFVMHSSSDSRPDVGNASQAIYFTPNYQPDAGNGSQIIHSGPDSRPEVGSVGQHVIDIHR